MIRLDQVAGTTRTLPDSTEPPPLAALNTPRGRATLIILERDGSLHHYPPDQPTPGSQRALMDLHQEQVEPHILNRIIEFTFDVLGLSKLEVRVHEHQQR